MGKGEIRLPIDYQYDNAKPSEKLKANTIFGLAVELDENLEVTGSRSSYANWVASEANPRFTTVIVNRLWKEVFGLALIEPLDNMFDDPKEYYIFQHDHRICCNKNHIESQ
mgnify:CR=1 FL=1